MARSLVAYEEKFQDYLELLKVSEYTRFNRVIREMQTLLTKVFAELDGELSAMRRAGLERFIRSVATKQKKLLEGALRQYKDRMESFSGYSYQIEAGILVATTGAAILNGARARAIFQRALERPIGATGDLLEPWTRNTSASQIATLEKTLRKAYVNGWTNQQTMVVLRGTKKANYADGLLSRFGKQNATMIRTAMQHINNSARQVLWAENSDIVVGYRWVSTLDGRTSDICQDLDGEVFDIGEGPLPPAHPNCRSTTVAELDKRFDVLDEGATRSSEDGYVDADTTFAEWQAEQEE